jgi:predicted N-acetyltransferase YhbS
MTLALATFDEAVLAPERPRDAPRVEALIAAAFGPGRYAKSVERLREGRAPDLTASFVAWRGGRALGCVRLWPILVAETLGLLLGPIAVDEDWRRQGLGAQLVERACAAAAQGGQPFVLLVGDPPFFGPLGFSAAAARRVRLPGPVDQARVMARILDPKGPPDLAGDVRAA